MTYSIVALDPTTGELGVAVQSRWFSVGRGPQRPRGPGERRRAGRARRRRFAEQGHLPGGGAVLQALGLA